MWVPPHGVISEVGSSAPAPGKLFLGPIAAGNCPPKRPVSPTSLVPSQGKEGRWNRSKVESRHPSPLVPSVLLACFLIYFQSHILPRDTNTPFVWGFPKRSHKCTPCMPEKTHRWLLRAGFYKHVPPDLRQVLLGRARTLDSSTGFSRARYSQISSLLPSSSWFPVRVWHFPWEPGAEPEQVKEMRAWGHWECSLREPPPCL